MSTHVRSSIYKHLLISTCYDVNITDTMKIVEKFVKKVDGERLSFIERNMLLVLNGIASASIPMCTKTCYCMNKENYFEMYTYQGACSLSLPLYNMSSCQSVLKYMSLYGELCIFTQQLPGLSKKYVEFLHDFLI